MPRLFLCQKIKVEVKWMVWIGMIVFSSVIILIVMVKTAFENNIEWHQLELSGSQPNMRLFFISDTHTRTISERMLSSFTNTTFDAVIIGGDFADQRTKDVVIEKNLKLLSSLGPLFFVWGNNDREVGEEKLQTFFAKYHVSVIANDAVVLKEGQVKLWLSAIDDTSTKQYSIEKAFSHIQDNDQVVFVSHNPAVFTKVQQNYHADLMIGGHLHGGQIRFGSLGLQPHGFYKMVNGCMTLVSNGYGTTLVPLRLCAKPQVHVIDILFK